MTGGCSVDVVWRSGGKDREVMATNADGGERPPLEHEDVVYPFPGAIHAGFGVFPGKSYLPSAILTCDRYGLHFSQQAEFDNSMGCVLLLSFGRTSFYVTR
jgi:hypothetical protein